MSDSTQLFAAVHIQKKIIKKKKYNYICQINSQEKMARVPSRHLLTISCN